MNDKFYDLTKEKQDKLINGGMQIFATNRYTSASTDEMVKVSGVSKGLWFHYFENKLGLYNFICSYAVRYFLLELSMKHSNSKEDYFTTKLIIEKIKMSLADKYPYLPLMLLRMNDETNEEALNEILPIKESYNNYLFDITVKSYSKSFDDENIARKVDYIMNSTFEKLLREEYRAPYFDSKRYLNSVVEYLNLAKKYSFNCEDFPNDNN